MGVVIHSSAKDYAYADWYMGMDILSSISPEPIAASGNEGLVEAIGQIPLAWLLTETDTSKPPAVLAS
jgi:Tat protein secretion system quality control protein TatD with DNase activity